MKVQINKSIVKRQIRGVKFIRNGRGFSKSELREVRIIDISMAKNKDIPIDILRKTTIAENVERLKPIAKDILNLRKAAGKKKS
jgi:ribosomal protein L13E